MIKRLLIAMAMVVMLPVFSAANDGRNGLYWSEINEYARMGYVFGLIDGVFAGRYFCLKASETCDKTYIQEMVKHLEGVSPKQVMKHVNAFYSEYANRNIDIFNAFYIVLMEIGGEPEAFVEAFTRDLREGNQSINDDFGLSP